MLYHRALNTDEIILQNKADTTMIPALNTAHLINKKPSALYPFFDALEIRYVISMPAPKAIMKIAKMGTSS